MRATRRHRRRENNAKAMCASVFVCVKLSSWVLWLLLCKESVELSFTGAATKTNIAAYSKEHLLLHVIAAEQSQKKTTHMCSACMINSQAAPHCTDQINETITYTLRCVCASLQLFSTSSKNKWSAQLRGSALS